MAWTGSWGAPLLVGGFEGRRTRPGPTSACTLQLALQLPTHRGYLGESLPPPLPLQWPSAAAQQGSSAFALWQGSVSNLWPLPGHCPQRGPDVQTCCPGPGGCRGVGVFAWGGSWHGMQSPVQAAGTSTVARRPRQVAPTSAHIADRDRGAACRKRCSRSCRGKACFLSALSLELTRACLPACMHASLKHACMLAPLS